MRQVYMKNAVRHNDAFGDDGGAFKGHPYAFDNAQDMAGGTTVGAVKKEKPALPVKESNQSLGINKTGAGNTQKTTVQTFKDDLKAIANKDIVTDTMKMAKANMTGVMIGGVIGVVICFATGRSAWIGALAGGVVGGVSAFAITKIAK